MTLFIHITSKTNQRIEIENIWLKNNYQPTDEGKIMTIIGCTMIMGYNKVLKMEYYWCDNPFLKNECISK